MNNRAAQIAQAARGPVMLITFGVLFAMHQAGVVSIWRSWPLILIVLGVMKLIERMVGPQVVPYPGRPYPNAPYPPPPPPAPGAPRP
jgi:hypothetical protein